MRCSGCETPGPAPPSTATSSASGSSRPTRPGGRCSCAPAARTTTTTSACSPSATARRRRRSRPGCTTSRGRSTRSTISPPRRGCSASAASLVGATDHGVSKSLYAKDPDGIEFEVMWQVPRGPMGRVRRARRPRAARSAGRARPLGRRRDRLTPVPTSGGIRLGFRDDPRPDTDPARGGQRSRTARSAASSVGWAKVKPSACRTRGSTRWPSNRRASARSRAEHEPGPERRDRHDGRAVQHVAERVGELGVGDRRRCREVDRPGHRRCRAGG